MKDTKVLIERPEALVICKRQSGYSRSATGRMLVTKTVAFACLVCGGNPVAKGKAGMRANNIERGLDRAR